MDDAGAMQAIRVGRAYTIDALLMQVMSGKNSKTILLARKELSVGR